MNIKNQNTEYTFESLRLDLQLFQEKNTKGEAAWILFDPVADKYFKLGQKEHSVISFLSKPVRLSELYEKIKNIDNQITKEDIAGVISFLHGSNLLQAAYSVTEKKIHQYKLLKTKNKINVFSSVLFIFQSSVMET